MGVGGHAQVRCSREEVIDGGGQIQRGDVIALPSEDSFDGEPADSERETRLGFQKIPWGANESTRVGAAWCRQAESQIQVPGIFCGGEPAPRFTARVGEIGEKPSRIDLRVLLGELPEGRKSRTRAAGC
jgi:hypothetical protein